MGMCQSSPSSKGKGTSKRNQQHQHHQQEEAMGSLPTFNSSEALFVESANRFDEVAVSKLRKELAEDAEVFLLNNILMSVMFFENYEREINRIATTITRQEKELNHRLIQEESKQCVMPDVIFEHVNKHVRFRPVHGPKKQFSEPLVPQKLYIVHDNIEVTDSEYDTSHYSGIDKPNYKIKVALSENSGFVKLCQLDQLNTKRSNSEETLYNASSTSSDAEKTVAEINRKIEDFNGILDGPSTSSGVQETSDAYDYTTITKARTPQPVKAGVPRKSNSLPDDCFTSIKMPNLDELSDSDDESEATESDLYKTVTYIKSNGFMRYFKNTVFPNSLGKSLGFDEDTIKSAKSIPGTIFCDIYDSKGNISLKEIIPAVSIDWPGEITFEWALRDDRPTIIDRRTTLRYKWPTDSMINDIKRMHCVVVPRGCLKKRGVNDDYRIEWEIAFPKAEKYIETRMSHAQMRSYLFLAALHKTFIEPVTKKQGLLLEHLKILMYWECEANYPNWPENRLGKKLISVLKHLYDCLGKGKLSNYFIRNKNVFEDVPGKYLRPAQRLVFRVTESPVMYFLQALRNLRYTSGKFYPPLDVKKLYNILTNEGMQSANPMLFKMVEAERQPFKKKKYDDPLVEWKMKHERIRRKKQQVEKKQDTNLVEQRRPSVDSINLKWSLEPELDMLKRRSILIFFIEHFIEIAKRSVTLATTLQSLFYLKQAYYLSKLLEETYGCYPDAIEYQEQIRKEEEFVKRVAANEETIPTIPRRNSSHPPNGDLVQQVKGNSVHLSSLAKSYNSNLKSEATKRKLKRSMSSKTAEEMDRIQRPSGERHEGRRVITFSNEIQSRHT